MNIFWYLFLFFLYGFFGWVVDVAYRSISTGRLEEGSAFHLPFCPIYGFGALLILIIAPWLVSFHWVVQGILVGTFVTFFEYLGGWFTEKFLGRRCWDYTGHLWNLHGRTDIEHWIGWCMASVLFLFWIHPAIEQWLR